LRWQAPAEPLWVSCDRSRLTQAVCNLITNASKYSPDASEVMVRLDHDGGDAVVSVADRGAGIPPAMLDSIFEMFTQVERTLDRSQGGLGIGLSLVRQLVQQHGGAVHAESAGVDRGSRFVIRLPALDAQQAATAEGDIASAPPTTPRASPAGDRPLKVLVVDDNADAADSLALLLECEGHRTRTEYSGQAAVTAAAEFRPDAVLCDVGMPGMDGHAVARALRADAAQASTRLIALTGWGNEDDKQRTRAAGFDAHLVKPVGFDDVISVLRAP
jgi:CheY-like chemotaxis protein